jgi:UDP-N-acetylmuramoylalanine--D-glutamate ligase
LCADAIIDGVTTAAELLGVDCAIITQTVAAYQGLPHRCQLVSEWRGIRFVNDSKGTNVGAAVTALKSMSGPVLLIAGGREKATSLDPLREALRERVKRVFLMGEARERMQAAFDQTVPVELVMNMDGAVAAAVEHAEAGDTVLLSPACASFDMYADYAARGEDFVRCVQAATCGGAH